MNARFEVVHGSPNDEELAVVISLLTAAAAGAPAAPPAPPASHWASSEMRVTHRAGHGGWYASGLPR